MKLIFSLILPILLLPIFGFSQIGNSGGRHDSLIEAGYSHIESIVKGNKKQVLKQFSAKGMQTSKEAKQTLSNDNVEWLNGLIKQFGMADRRNIGISEWIVNKGEKGKSVNLTYYFKDAQKPFTIYDDHISFNFSRDPKGRYVLDGILFFRKDEFERIQNQINKL